jgi:hypothetical protein
MSAQKLLVRGWSLYAVALVAAALVPFSPGDARAITFGDWAISQGWPAGHIMPNSVGAWSASIDSLAGIGDYDWTTTPTRYLYLNSNQIASIESGALAGLDHLIYLSLYDNRLTSLGSGAFAGLGSLTELELYGNQIAGIESDAFAGLDNLTELYLGGNQITSIESGDFAGLGHLAWLWLNYNRITSIESGALAGLRSLDQLDLGNNQIASLESDGFAGLDNLTWLWLSHNQITSVGSRSFAGLGNLLHVGLYENQISSIAPNAFAELGKLEYLDLGYNASLTSLNLEGGNFSSLGRFDVANDTNIAHISLRGAVLTQTALVSLVTGSEQWPGDHIGIGELPSVTELDLSCVDFAAITDLAPLYLMDNLMDLWLVDVANLDANALDTLLDNLATMEAPSIEGVLHLTRTDFDAFNVAGGGKLTAWDAETGHHVDIIGLGDANADGVVDSADATILASHWHQADGANWFAGDFNGDGAVNDADASILAAHWGEGMEETPLSIPEPITLVMLAGAAVSLVGSGRWNRFGQ